MRTVAGASCALLLAALTANRPLGAAAGSCEDLSQLSLANATVTLAQTVASGSFTPPAADTTTASLRPLTGLTTFCRVAATLRPSPDSEESQSKCGCQRQRRGRRRDGMASSKPSATARSTERLNTRRWRRRSARGYAPIPPTWRPGNNGRFAIGHPEKVIDFGWRADRTR